MARLRGDEGSILRRVNTIYGEKDMFFDFMKTLNENQYKLIKPYLPVQRRNVKISNLSLINAVLYVAENGYKWRA